MQDLFDWIDRGGMDIAFMSVLVLVIGFLIGRVYADWQNLKRYTQHIVKLETLIDETEDILKMAVEKNQEMIVANTQLKEYLTMVMVKA